MYVNVRKDSMFVNTITSALVCILLRFFIMVFVSVSLDIKTRLEPAEMPVCSPIKTLFMLHLQDLVDAFKILATMLNSKSV